MKIQGLEITPQPRKSEESENYYFVPVGSLGVYLPRCTEILGTVGNDWLAKWYGRVGIDEAERVSGEAMAIGSEVHYWVEQILKGHIITPDEWAGIVEPAKNGIRAFVRFQKEWGCKAYSDEFVEKTVYSVEDGYAGTLDMVGITGFPTGKSSTILVDWKTSKQHDQKHVVQLGAYHHALLKCNPGMKVNGGMIGRLDKLTGIPDMRYITLKELRAGWECYKHILKVWYYFNGDRVAKENMS